MINAPTDTPKIVITLYEDFIAAIRSDASLDGKLLL